jgi:hypothetical protein
LRAGVRATLRGFAAFERGGTELGDTTLGAGLGAAGIFTSPKSRPSDCRIRLSASAASPAAMACAIGTRCRLCFTSSIDSSRASSAIEGVVTARISVLNAKR